MKSKWMAGLTAGLMVAGAAAVWAAEAKDPILELKEKIIDIQNKGELGFRNFTACSNIVAYGSYVPLPAPEVKAGSEILFYYEPENIFTNRVKGQYEIWYTQDIILLNSDGEVLLNQENALDFHFHPQSPVLDLYAQNSLSLGQLPPGVYVYRAVIHDKLKKTEAGKNFKFEIVK